MSTILSVSIPSDLRTTLDTEAKRQRRSRSFVVAEAVREYVARQQDVAFAEASERTLREGLALSGPERIALAEQLWQELTLGQHPDRAYTAAFDTFDEYDHWRRTGGALVK